MWPPAVFFSKGALDIFGPDQLRWNLARKQFSVKRLGWSRRTARLARHSASGLRAVPRVPHGASGKVSLLIYGRSSWKRHRANSCADTAWMSGLGENLSIADPVHRAASGTVTTFWLTVFLLSLFFFPPIYNQVFTFWFMVKQEFAGKKNQERYFFPKSFQNPTALMPTCYSVIVRFKFSGKWASY